MRELDSHLFHHLNFPLISASNDNIRLWDLKMSLTGDGGTVTGGAVTPSRGGGGGGSSSSSSTSLSSSQANSPSSNKDSLGGAGGGERGKRGKVLDVNDASFFAAPIVPFKIVPGHHGGVVSSMRKVFFLSVYECVECEL